MSREAVERSRSIIERCHALGFALAGVCDASPTAFGEQLDRWLADGKHGEMTYLKRDAAAKRDLNLVLDGARSAIVVADLYATRDDVQTDPAPGRGHIARYAQGRDYHRVIKRRLYTLCDELAAAYPEDRFRAVVDTAPVPERELAVRAGIGWTGKHTLAIHPRAGSWMLLGCVLTTLELPPPPEQERHTDHCGTCTRCIDACPTDAIEPYSVDARRCISYLTIEHRSAIDEPLHPGMGDWLAGCDICQRVCPHNSPRPGATEFAAHPAYASQRSGLDLFEVLGWSDEDRRTAFAGSALTRMKLHMLRRNALIAIGNDVSLRENPDAVVRVRAIAQDPTEPEPVKRAAAETLRRLNREPAP
ncbi:MAG: tRNA epoxyqueuosine(34) reductase QueG [Planctomycetota bacterium]